MSIQRNKKFVKKKWGTKLLDITASNRIVAVRLKNVISEKGLKQVSVASKAGFTDKMAKTKSSVHGVQNKKIVTVKSYQRSPHKRWIK